MSQPFYEAISHLAAGQVFALVAPPTAALPYLVYTPVAQQTVMGLSGPHTLCRLQVQVDAWAESYEQARALQDEVLQLLVSQFPTLADARVTFSDFEPQTHAYRVSSDYVYYA